MKDFPHKYVVAAYGDQQGDVRVTAAGVPSLASASPVEFDGPGDRWSPETFLAGALADCFVLTFRAVARASKLSWRRVQCRVTATLDRVDGETQFTAFALDARVEVKTGTDTQLALRVMEKAERNCLISNSLKGAVHLNAVVDTVDPDANGTDVARPGLLVQ
jgi:organic hydroperoxide reductase OsmC/OhrA